MPGKVKVKIVAGRSLPVMDRSNDTTDAYVEVKLGQVTHKTDVCRKSLNPQFNSEWFRFEVDDLDLQDEPLQIRLMDHDTYSANDAIGKVYLDLNPLLFNTSKGKDSTGKMISGWIPVYDTMHGIRGEVNLIVKVELFSDLNKYRQSSCGVRFFFTQGVPEGYVAHTIQGFVEELVVNDDPEYQWIDKIRTPRASNEARQTLFSKLSGEVQRKVGLKTLELGGNAVIGYKQCFDLEGESGIVVRGIGTAIFLTKIYDSQLSPTFGVFEANRESFMMMSTDAHHHSSRFRSVRKSHLHCPARGGSPGRTPRLKRHYSRSSSLHNSMSINPSSPPLPLSAAYVNCDAEVGATSAGGFGGGITYSQGANKGYQQRQAHHHHRHPHHHPLRHQLHHVSDPDDDELYQSLRPLAPTNYANTFPISGGGGGDGRAQGSSLHGLKINATCSSPMKYLRPRGGGGGGGDSSSSSPCRQVSSTSRTRRISSNSNKLRMHVPMMEPLVQTDNDDEDEMVLPSETTVINSSNAIPVGGDVTLENNLPSFPNSLTSTITPPPGSYPPHTTSYLISSNPIVQSNWGGAGNLSNNSNSKSDNDNNEEDEEDFIVVLDCAPPPPASAPHDNAKLLLTKINNAKEFRTPDTNSKTKTTDGVGGLNTGGGGRGGQNSSSVRNSFTNNGSQEQDHSHHQSKGFAANANNDCSGGSLSVFNPIRDTSHSDVVKLSSLDLIDPITGEIQSQRQGQHSNSVSLPASSNNSFSSISFRGKSNIILNKKVNHMGGSGGGNSDDSDDDSIPGTGSGGPNPKKERFAILRRRRKKDKYSTNCLIKRASELHVDKEPPLPGMSSSSGTERIKEEFAKLLKRMTSGDHHQVKNGRTKIILKSEDGCSSTSSTKAHSSPYREPSRFFFRSRRRTASGGRERPLSFRRLVRSNSDSHSLNKGVGGAGGGAQTSLESLPSLGSEPVFDLEEDGDDDDDDLSDPNCSSLIEMPTYTRPGRSRRESENNNYGRTSDLNCVKGEGTATDDGDEEVGGVISSKINESDNDQEIATLPLDKTQLKRFIEELGYDSNQPLKLYISSMDALLVHDPLDGGSSGSGSTSGGGGSCFPIAASSFSNTSAELANTVPRAFCGSSAGGMGIGNVVNLDSDSDLDNFIQLSRTSTGSSTDANKPILSSFKTFNSNEMPHHHHSEVKYGVGTETSMSTTNTDSSHSSSLYSKQSTNEPSHYHYDGGGGGGQPRRHHYHTSRALDIRRRGGGNHNSPGVKFITRSHRRVETTTGNTTTDEDDYLSVGVGAQGFGSGDSDDNFDFCKNMHDFGIMTGCRSPIPEELSETPTTTNSSSWINKCAISNNSNNINPSTSPPNPQQQPAPLLVQSSLRSISPISNSQPPPLIPIVTSPQPEPPFSSSFVVKEKTLTKETPKVQLPQSSATPNGNPLTQNEGLVIATTGTNDVCSGAPSGIGKVQPRDDASDSSANRSASGSPEKVTGQSGTPFGTATVTSAPSTGANNVIPIPSRNHSQQYSSCGGIPLNRRSSESDLSTPPKGTPSNFTNTSSRSQFQRSGINFEHVEMLEFPFITISQFPPGFIFYLGGTVTARSVKLLERISNLEEPETRDAWWNEIRMEIRSHCRAFGCTVVLGYEEHTTMCDDVCILSASGTAAVVGSGNLSVMDGLNIAPRPGEILKDRVGIAISGRTESFSSHQPNVRQSANRMQKLLSANKRIIEFADEDVMVQGLRALPPPLLSKHRHDSDGSDPNCSILHIPHRGTPLPISIRMTRCVYCRKGKVPDVLLSTIEIPPGIHITGRSCLIQAQVFRPKRDCKGEQSAKEVSDSVPFLEYELHRRLINKLKVKGLNAIFGLKVQICLGDKLMVGIATGTAVYITALPAPTVPIICAGNMKTDSQKVVQFQKVVQDTFDKNRELFEVKNIIIPNMPQGSSGSSDGEDSDDDVQDELLHRNKDTFVLEVDDAEDIDIISMLIDTSPPVGFNLNNIETLIGFDDHRVISQQMFCQVWRCRLPSLSLRQFTTYFDRLIRCVTFKLRRMQPLVLTKLAFRIELPEPDEMQLSMIGMALGVDVPKIQPSEKESLQTTPKTLQLVKDEPEMIFPLEEERDGACELGGPGGGAKNNKKSPGGSNQSQQNNLNTTTTNLSAAAMAVQQLLKTGGSSLSGVGGGSGPIPPNVTVVNPASGGGIGGGGTNGNVSSSCISVVSSSSSTTPTSTSTSNNGGGVGVPLSGSGGGFGWDGGGRSSANFGGMTCGQSDPQPPSVLNVNNSSKGPTTPPAALPNVPSTSSTTSTTSNSCGLLANAHSYSVRHPHSKSAKFMAQMLLGAQKPIPAPMSKMRYWVEITPLSYIHGARIEKYLGNLNFFFIRETTSIREVSGGQESGGLTGFVHHFITEVLAIVRAHVAALGGNAMVSYFMTECALLHNPHKNQGQCVVNVGGDAVFVMYPGGSSHPEEGIS